MSVEHLVEGLTGEPFEDWLFTNHGAGNMFLDSKLFGRMYLGDDPEEHDRVVFLGAGMRSDDCVG